VRLAVIPVSSAASAPHRVDEHADLRLVDEPELGALSDPAARATRLDARMLAILASGPAHGETLDAAFRRKEHELGAVFARLSVAESRALHRRLSVPAQDDLVAARFGQLIVERRGRLLAFLADARRREAIAKFARG